jgi:ketosteroid isomerase-like protein
MKLTNAKDWEKDLALYTEDAIQLPPSDAAVQGKVAIQAWLETLPPFFQLPFAELGNRGAGESGL